MSTFGDAEPEDAWHPDDALDVLALNLGRRMELLDGQAAGTRIVSVVETLDDVSRRLERRRLEPMTSRDGVRVLQLMEDLAFVRERLNLDRFT